MTQSIAGQPAPELAVPYWIGAEGKERPPLTLKELGARHRLLFFYQYWCGGCHSHVQALAQYPHRGRRGRRSPDRIRGRLRQYARSRPTEEVLRAKRRAAAARFGQAGKHDVSETVPP